MINNDTNNIYFFTASSHMTINPDDFVGEFLYNTSNDFNSILSSFSLNYSSIDFSSETQSDVKVTKEDKSPILQASYN